MSLQRCSGAVRATRAPGGAFARRWPAALAGLGLGLAAEACSDAGGGADPAPFPSAGAGGGATVAVAPGSGGSESPSEVSSGGAAGQEPEPDNLLDGPGDLIEDEPEPEPEPQETGYPESPSCENVEPDACQGESCCLREAVPAADLMTVAPNVTVQLSPYELDKFEVTVGRFRQFVAAFDDWRDAGNPESDAGEHPHTPGSGWNKDPSWEVELAGSAAVLRVGLNCNANQQTWTDEPGFNELKPINCVSWYEAIAFCAWDEGRLPTEAEWQYAAVGGAQGRTFAWGNTPLGPSFAAYACQHAGTGSSCTADDVPEVGTHPDGDGLFGHGDLVGSLYEWTLDWYAPYPELMRDDYAKTDMGTQRVLRGGAWNSTTTAALISTDRSFRAAPNFRSPTTGIRCARDVVEVPR